jgi:hypothetical protein
VVVLTSAASPADQTQVTELGGICCIKPSNLEAVKTLAIEIMALCKGTGKGLTASLLT